MNAIAVGITYAGAEYIVMDRTLQQVESTIADAAVAARPIWFGAAMRDGRGISARLLIGPGTPVALWEVEDDGGQATREDFPEDFGLDDE